MKSGNKLFLLRLTQNLKPLLLLTVDDDTKIVSDLPAFFSDCYQDHTPGGGHKFYEEFGPISRSGPPDPKVLAPIFEKYDMSLLGPPLSLD